MTMQIIETVLALVLLYLVLSLLASQLNEFRAATFGSRPKTTDKVVAEAFPGSPTLMTAFFAYPPVFSLSKGSGKPSAIPPELFAQAWMAVIDGKGPPRGRHRFPSEFVTAATSPESSLDPKMKELLKWLVAGVESDWDAFEARAAQWYADICDRAQGWFKRRTALWLLVISFLLTFTLNVDTHFIFKNLMENDAQRVALADLAELVNAQQQKPAGPADRAAAPAPPLTPTTPLERSIEAGKQLQEAIDAATRANKDPAVLVLSDNVDEVTPLCRNRYTRPPGATQDNRLFASNPDAWPEILRRVRQDLASVADNALIAEESIDTPNGHDGRATSRLVARPLSDEQRKEVLVGSAACVNAVDKWISLGAQREVKDSTRKDLALVAARLAKVRGYIAEERRSAALSQSLRRRFEQDPRSVIGCSEDFPQDRIGFSDCLRQTVPTRLPLGWPAPFPQLCEAHLVQAGQTLSNDKWFCPDLPAAPGLDVPGLKSTTSGTGLASMVVGWLLTTLLVSLGAPFWFGVLGKVADLRLAGRVRGMSSTDGDESTPTSGGGGKGAGGGAPKNGDLRGSPTGGGSGGAGGFDDARNVFEQTLRPQDIRRLQKAINAPATGRLDVATRARIAQELGNEEELTPITFEQLTGRKAPVAVSGATDAASNGGTPGTSRTGTGAAVSGSGSGSGPWERGSEGGSAIQELIVALNRIFPAMPDWDPLPAGTRFTDEVRARVVLYRMLTDATGWADRQMTKDAQPSPAELRRLDDTLRREILAETRTFSPPPDSPWLFDALGELGIAEKLDTGGFDPRVTAYLATLGTSPPGTAWCGAFAAWVMDRHGQLKGNYAGALNELLLASNWRKFGKEVEPEEARAGDICVAPREGNKFHVAILLALKPNGRALLLGGNQGDPSAVTSITFKAFTSIRRPQ